MQAVVKVLGSRLPISHFPSPSPSLMSRPPGPVSKRGAGSFLRYSEGHQSLRKGEMHNRDREHFGWGPVSKRM